MPRAVQLDQLDAATATHSPAADMESWEWWQHAACRGVDSSVFFSPDGERGPSRAKREQQAKRWCEGCPVLAQCRAYALANAEPYGVWGGLSEAERSALLRRRPSRSGHYAS